MSRKDKTFREFWQLLCTLVKRAESMDVEHSIMDSVLKILESASSTKVFLKLQKATWEAAGQPSQLSSEEAKRVPGADRAQYFYKWAKRFGPKLEMRPRLSELQSPVLTQCHETLQRIEDGLTK